ncbi:MAG: hypothetical protein H6Q64_2366 [Firmicutes bacterium]|nr:hypothetical protein [Bacillota bacterium]
MFKNKKGIVVKPAYNGGADTENNLEEVMAQEICNLVILANDANHNDTPTIAWHVTQDQGACI